MCKGNWCLFSLYRFKPGIPCWQASQDEYSLKPQEIYLQKLISNYLKLKYGKAEEMLCLTLIRCWDL
jgi:hypothetical protein